MTFSLLWSLGCAPPSRSLPVANCFASNLEAPLEHAVESLTTEALLRDSWAAYRYLAWLGLFPAAALPSNRLQEKS